MLRSRVRSPFAPPRIKISIINQSVINARWRTYYKKFSQKIKGVNFLANYLKLGTTDYQFYLIQKFKGKGVTKTSPVAIKILRILGNKPTLRLTDEEYRRLERCKTSGPASFNETTVGNKATQKAMMVKPLELLKLTQSVSLEAIKAIK